MVLRGGGKGMRGEDMVSRYDGKHFRCFGKRSRCVGKGSVHEFLAKVYLGLVGCFCICYDLSKWGVLGVFEMGAKMEG